jgi:hypothetical protein
MYQRSFSWASTDIEGYSIEAAAKGLANAIREHL